MRQNHEMQYSVKSVIAWLVLAFAVLLGLGAIPTVLLGGRRAFASQAVIGAVVLAIMIVNAVAMKAFARQGPMKFAFAFVVSGAVRVLLCTVLIIVARRAFDLHRVATLVWTCGFYLGLLIVEGVCIARALNRDAFREALGEFSSRRTVPKSETDERKQEVADRQRQPD